MIRAFKCSYREWKLIPFGKILTAEEIEVPVNYEKSEEINWEILKQQDYALGSSGAHWIGECLKYDLQRYKVIAGIGEDIFGECVYVVQSKKWVDEITHDCCDAVITAEDILNYFEKHFEIRLDGKPHRHNPKYWQNKGYDIVQQIKQGFYMASRPFHFAIPGDTLIELGNELENCLSLIQHLKEEN